MQCRSRLFVIIPRLSSIGIVWLLALAAKAPARPASGPAIVLAERSYDFGKIPVEGVVKHEFIFTNVGNALLELPEVRPSCGCVVVGEWSRQVEPGKAGTIAVAFKSTSFVGPVRKTIRLVCNDLAQTNLFLELKGQVWAPIDVVPALALLRVPAEDPSNAMVTVRITNNLDDPVTLSPPECTNQGFAAQLKQLRPGKEFQLTIRPVLPLNPAKPYGLISIKTSSPQMPLLRVTAYAQLQQTLTVTPPHIRLPPGPATNKLYYSLIIRDFSTNGTVLSEPTINADGVAIDLKEFEPGKYFNVRLTFPAGFKLLHNEPVEFRVRSNHPQIPLIRGPVVDSREAAGAAQISAVDKKLLLDAPPPH